MRADVTECRLKGSSSLLASTMRIQQPMHATYAPVSLGQNTARPGQGGMTQQS